MKKTLFSVLFLLSCCPLRAGTVLLWIPGEHAPLEDVLSRLEAGPDLKLTAALSEIPAALAERIKSLSDTGRLELAARPSGDPLIPLFYYPREESVRWQSKPSTATLTNDPFFISLRMSDARDLYVGTLKRAPEAFVGAPGGTVAEYVPLARALGFKWLAAGMPASSTASFRVIDAEGVRLVLFSTPSFAGVAAGTGTYEFAVYDETSYGSGEDTRGALLSVLTAAGNPPFMTVSEALKTVASSAMPAAQAVQLTAPWSGDYTPWTGAPIQAGALAAFARTRSELMAHFNAKQGDYKAAEPAFTEYFSVESGPRLLDLAGADPDAAKETEIEIQNALANSYRLMDKAPPGWLFSALSDLDETAEAEDKATVKKSSAGFALVNALRQPVLPSVATPGVHDPARVWKLAETGVSWTDGELIFSFSPGEAVTTPAEAEGLFAAARFDLYIDINNRPRAGAARLLEGRGGRLFPDNAWEYALGVSPKTAALYAATNTGPKILKTYPSVFTDGAFTVRVPRTDLRGNPGLWSYTAFMLYTADDRTFSVTDFLAEDFSNGYYYAVRPAKK